jgi:hypothetical protein
MGKAIMSHLTRFRERPGEKPVGRTVIFGLREIIPNLNHWAETLKMFARAGIAWHRVKPENDAWQSVFFEIDWELDWEEQVFHPRLGKKLSAKQVRKKAREAGQETHWRKYFKNAPTLARTWAKQNQVLSKMSYRFVRHSTLSSFLYRQTFELLSGTYLTRAYKARFRPRNDERDTDVRCVVCPEFAEGKMTAVATAPHRLARCQRGELIEIRRRRHDRALEHWIHGIAVKCRQFNIECNREVWDELELFRIDAEFKNYENKRRVIIEFSVTADSSIEVRVGTKTTKYAHMTKEWLGETKLLIIVMGVCGGLNIEVDGLNDLITWLTQEIGKSPIQVRLPISSMYQNAHREIARHNCEILTEYTRMENAYFMSRN